MDPMGYLMGFINQHHWGCNEPNLNGSGGRFDRRDAHHGALTVRRGFHGGGRRLKMGGIPSGTWNKPYGNKIGKHMEHVPSYVFLPKCYLFL
jgi:hypothetical protein